MGCSLLMSGTQNIHTQHTYMKTLLTLAAIVITLAALHFADDAPIPVPYEPSDSEARVRAFIVGEIDHIDESDLYSPTVSDGLRSAAIDR